MTLLHRLASVLAWLFNRNRAEQDRDEELKAFVDMSAAEKMRDGLPPAQARRLAMIELGGIEPVKERVRAYRHGGWLDEIGRDVRYAIRTSLASPGFTFGVVSPDAAPLLGPGNFWLRVLAKAPSRRFIAGSDSASECCLAAHS